MVRFRISLTGNCKFIIDFTSAQIKLYTNNMEAGKMINLLTERLTKR
jgi:predicted Ser/Thr protein kinase